MARYGGQFDPEIKRPGQFDAELNRGGQFDRDLIDTGTPDDGPSDWFTVGTRSAIAAALSLSLSAGALCAGLQRQQDEIFSAGVTPQLEEEYWRNPTPPIAASLLWPQQWTFDQQEPAGSLRGVPEEEAGLLAPPPPLQIINGFLYATSDDVVTASAAGQPDEDYWSSGVAPVRGALSWPQQWTFDQQEPAGSLRGVPEEDAYLPYRGSLLVAPPIVAKTDTDEVVQTTPTLQPDEDFWTNGVAPGQAKLSWPQQWGFDQQEPAGSLRGVLEEEAGFLLLLATPPIAPLVEVSFFATQEEVVTDVAPAEEDYWINGVAPTRASLIWSQQWLGDSQEAVQPPPPGMPDEDFWVSGVAPIRASLIWPQQAAFDVQEITQAPIALPPDEDFWRSGVAPVIAIHAWPQQWGFDVQEPGNLRGQPDEDFWVSGVAPVQASLAWPQPWTFETPERGTPPIPLPPDEDFWKSGVAPIQATLAWPQPWTFDVQEPAGSLFTLFVIVSRPGREPFRDTLDSGRPCLSELNPSDPYFTTLNPGDPNEPPT